VHARFLLGPAGSGKTFRCLAEVRAALANNPEGEPLIFLAPKQATFQLERQLLAGAEISGYTRLNIFSFDRLARFIFEKANLALPPLLAEEGRVMILRALLRRQTAGLKQFGHSARRPGFAQELSGQLAEFQRHHFAPAKLRALAQNQNLRAGLREKLDDLALLAEKYADWLRDHELHDANNLLDFATAALRDELKIKNSKLKIEALWLDGFAEMTPQELDLLAALMPFCENATLAFCLENEPSAATSWISIWSAIGKTFQECRARLENLTDAKIEIEILPREPGKNRFAENSELMLLEKCWNQTPRPPEKLKTQNSKLKIVSCANPGAEAVFAAHEILKFVRAGNRFRDCAVIVRNLDSYHQPLARVFSRFEIPFFLDRRESVAHHPLAELTRSALRTAAFEWQPTDLFAALKAGFCSADENEIDRLENAALEFGWHGQKWSGPLPDEFSERLRKKILPPLENFAARLAKLKLQPDGAQLAEILRELWDDLKVERQLQNWSGENSADSTVQRVNDSRNIHSAVFGQMNSWLDNLALAFPRESLPLRDWLPILEAGLANLTVGVIPPALDQVLIGAIDRARNPDLKLALVLGLNESVFPAAPASPVILTDADREELGISPGPDLRERLSRERFFGYIACTRAREKLILAFSRAGADGKALNLSPFIAHLQNIFPALAIEEFQNEFNLAEVEQANELAPFLFEVQNSKLKTQNWAELLELPALKMFAEKMRRLREPDEKENLSEEFAKKLYGPVLKSSVSRLEEFAQCPFKFFVRSGLHAGERKIFELDARERGNFQHDVLKVFHEQLQAEGKRWRDLEPAAARERIAKIAAVQMEDFRDGLLRDSAAARFAARAMTASLQNFTAVMVSWLRGQYEFDPVAAELGFGGKDSGAPAWEISLSGGHRLALQGRIDRVDLWRDQNRGTALAVVTDYKSGGKKLDAVLVAHGVQLQLLAYLGALRHWKNPRETFGVEKLSPAGAFYVNLRGDFKSGGTRTEVLGDGESQKMAYRHNGRFDAGELRKFDRRTDVTKGDQFNFRLNKGGQLPSNSTEAISCKEFTALLDQVEEQLRSLGERIFSGAAQVDPYRKGGATACDFCDYRAACRIDRWTHRFRVLRCHSSPAAMPDRRTARRP
jgi:ATP-dependent helicase/nuclease subunit B